MVMVMRNGNEKQLCNDNDNGNEGTLMEVYYIEVVMDTSLMNSDMMTYSTIKCCLQLTAAKWICVQQQL